MSDGAHRGVMATRALKTVLGGEEQPAASERLSPESMRAKILAAPDFPRPQFAGITDEPNADDYDQACMALAKLFMKAMEIYPELRSVGADTECIFFRDREPIVVSRGLYEIAKELHPEARLQDEGFTGFQVGFACNAARYALGLGPVSNPAIIEIPDREESAG